MYPITIIDNFYKDPYKIRDFALSQNFYQKGAWPGVRTDQFVKLHPDLFLEFAKKTLSVFFNIEYEQVHWNFNSTFQLCGKDFEEGWVHTDWDGKSANGATIAGIIYLTPGAPLSGGTSVYKLKDNEIVSDDDDWWLVRNNFYKNNTNVNLEEYRKKRDLYNNKFLKTLDIGNVFNRLVIYNTTDFHKENILFGNTTEDSRLTQVFFARVGTDATPLHRMLTNGKI